MENMNSLLTSMLQEKRYGMRFGKTLLTVTGHLLLPKAHAITDNWKEGTKVLFLDSKGSGMVSMVAENKPYRFMSFKHLVK